MYNKMDNILAYFIEEPEKEFHVRQIAKLEKKSPTTIAKYLEECSRNDLLTASRRLNHLFYKANAENPAFLEFKIAYNIAQIRKAGLIGFLEKEFKNPEAIVLFGSFRKGESTKRSDIDIAVVSAAKKEPKLDDYEKKIGRRIQLLVLSGKDIEAMKSRNKELLNNIANGIVLYGFLELFR